MPNQFKDLIQIRGLVVHHYALLEKDGGVILLDGGFLGNAIGRIEQALKNHGRCIDTDVRAILLSHGHIDHTLNIAELKKRTGAPVFAPKADESHISGNHTYQGISKICGFMESLARLVFRYQPPEIDEWYRAGDQFDLWGGLEVIDLSGHTAGHCGFFSKPRNTFFTCDLFANFYHHAKTPPPWFNVDEKQVKQSIVKASRICDDSTLVFPNHCHPGNGSAHLLDLKKLAAKITA